MIFASVPATQQRRSLFRRVIALLNFLKVSGHLGLVEVLDLNVADVQLPKQAPLAT